jgi:hypothetical protein
VAANPVFLIVGFRSVAVDVTWMGRNLHWVLIDPVTGAPSKNGKPLLLSYLVDGVKERTL